MFRKNLKQYMLRLHFKSFTLALSLIFTGNLCFSEKVPDAEILYNEETRHFDFFLKEGYYLYERIVKVKRKVRINTAYGLKKFNTLYIPTFRDLDYKMELTSLNGNTLKKSGEIIEISKENVKETTLPANVPLLYGYRGQVQQLVFSQVQPGDIIEYEYEVRYRHTTSSGFFYINDNILLAQDVPIHTAVYNFILDPGLDGLFYLSNASSQFEKEKRNYSIRIDNIPAIKNEAYSNIRADSPYILYEIMNDNSGVYSSWEKYIKKRVDKAKNREYFLLGRTVGDFNHMIKTKNLASTEDKILAINDEIDYLYTRMKNSYVMSIHRSEMNLTDAKQILKMIDVLNLDASILLLNYRESGKLIKDYISLSQFEYIVVEYKGEDGKLHYWEPVNPFHQIDQFPFYYTDNEALKLKFVEGKLTHSWYKVPPLDFSASNRTTKLTIQLSGESRPVMANAVMKVHETGQFAYFSRPYIKQEQTTELKNFSQKIKGDLNNWFYNTDVAKVEFESNDDGTTEYESDYGYTIYNGLYQDKMEFNIRDFIPSITFTNLNANRSTIAYLNHARQVNYEIDIQLPESYFTYIENEFLIRNIENDVARFKTNVESSGSSVVISIEYALKKDILTPEMWVDYVKVINEIESYYMQKLLVKI